MHSFILEIGAVHIHPRRSNAAAPGHMAKLSADVERALGIYRRVTRADKPNSKLKDIIAAADGVIDTTALFLLSKAALYRGAEIALFELGSDDPIHAAFQAQDAPRPHLLTPEAIGLFVLAGKLAWQGVARRSLLCAVFYVELVFLVSQPDAAEKLASLHQHLIRPVEWRDMFADITADSQPDTFLEKVLKVMHCPGRCQCC